MVYSVIQHEFFIRFWVINFSYFLYRSSHVSSPETVFISHEINENYLLSFTNSYLTSILLGVIYIYIYIYIEYGKAVNRLATLLQKDISIINQTFQILSCHFACYECCTHHLSHSLATSKQFRIPVPSS